MSTTASPSTPPASPVALPWGQDQRRSPIREAASPLLLPALRRLAQEPPQWHRPGELDKGRATRRRLAHIASWHRCHDPRPEAGLDWLPHVGPVLRGVGLIPSRVAEVLAACRIAGTPAGRVDDDTLMACAHLSLFEVIDVIHMPVMVRSGGWTPRDLLTWSQRYPAEHLGACERLPLSFTVLRDRLRAGTAPTVDEVAMMTAMRAPVPGIPAPAT